MDKVKILWISLNAPTVRSGKAGGNTFNYYFRKFVEDGRFSVKVIAQINDKMPLMDIPEENCFFLKREQQFISKLKRLSSIESKYNLWNRNANLLSNQMEAFVKNTIVQLKGEGFFPDAVILEWTQCVVLANLIRKLLPKTYIIASEHDVTFVAYERKADYFRGVKKILWSWKFNWEKKVEINALQHCDYILTHNRDYIDLLIENGIAKDRIGWLTPYFHSMNYIQRENVNTDILYFGAMDRPENYLSAIWFIENVMPRIGDLSVRFIIIGSNPSKLLKDYKNDKIVITGFVESIDSYFREGMCLCAPIVLGAGIKVKVLEALSSGIPVLTNAIGIEGIPAKKNIEYFYCDTPNEYEQAIRRIYNKEISAINIEHAAKQFIDSEFSITESLEAYKQLILTRRGTK